MKIDSRHRAFVILAGLTLLLTGCVPGSSNDAGPTDGLGTPPELERAVSDAETTWDVSLQEDARLVDFDAAAQLIEADP